ncbi:MAG: ADP-ribose pyrophosphatase YjhB (NUDIX family) [Myxococcota bacterium]|jgi:ADP-ribose pyrophosphatase YjhB (NUDIX family)
MHRPYSCCPSCGAALPEGPSWPKRCARCGRAGYLSPAPVGVVLQPVDGGLLLVERGIPPGLGEWALPGGFIDAHERWREGCVRELREETGLVVAPGALTLWELLDAPEANLLLIFVLAPPLSAAELPPFVVSSECTARRVASGPEPLAFPLHTAAVARFFAAP